MLTDRVIAGKVFYATSPEKFTFQEAFRLNAEYREVISLPNYPAIPTDATLEIKALRSNHTGIYRCEVMYGIEDRQDTIEVLVKGETLILLLPPRMWPGQKGEKVLLSS